MPNICEIDDCDNLALYGFISDFKTKYCINHKKIKNNLINIKNKNKYCKSCYYIMGSYAYENDKNNLYCKSCKLDDMIDIKNKRCLFEGCNKQQLYNFEGKTNAIYCGTHKEINMINIRDKKCLFENCKKRPNYNFEGKTNAIYCVTHKEINMIDIQNKRCITPLCDKIQNIDQYCIRCFYAINPNDNRCNRIKLKENETKKYLENNLKGLSFIFDTPIQGDGLCFNIRPDALLNLNKHSIIIEIDENQHKFYNSECDNARTHKIQESLNRPIIIIRFNPDNYIENNIKILSPFKIDKKLGLTTIPKNKESEWNNRLEILKTTILENIEYKYDEPLKIIKLFYDAL
jgi:hypothetical protein